MSTSAAQTQGAYMDLSGAELATIITASTVGAAAVVRPIGALFKWVLGSKVSREEWVEQRVRAAFADIEKTAAAANARADILVRRVDALESDKVKLLAVSQALIFELGRLDPNSLVLARAQRLLNLALPDDQVPFKMQDD